MNLIVWLVVGGIVGWLASIIMKRDAQQGIILNIIVGIVGAVIAGLMESGYRPLEPKTLYLSREEWESIIAERPLHLTTPYHEPESATVIDFEVNAPRDFAPESSGTFPLIVGGGLVLFSVLFLMSTLAIDLFLMSALFSVSCARATSICATAPPSNARW